MVGAGFWFQIIIWLLGGLLVVIFLGLAGWFSVRFMRRRKAAAPAAVRSLRLLVVLARPLVACRQRDADQNPVLTADWSEDGACRVPVAPLKAALSYEVLEQALTSMHAPITVCYLRAPTLAALDQALPEGFDALLFDGPGLEDGSLAFENPYGEQHAIPPDELGRYLRDSNVRLACLSACYSARAAQALRQAGVIAVAGMAEATRSDVVAGFVGDFFGALARGRNVYRALAEGRKAIAARLDVQAKEVRTPQISAWRWPALRLVRVGSTKEYSGSPALPSPVPLSVELVGRELDTVLVNRLLARSRLVTLIGLDGVGKTVLARAVAYWHWERGLAPASVRFISLENLHGGRHLADKLLFHLAPDYRTLGGLDEAGLLQHKVNWLSARMGQGKWLLVLDSFESVLDEEASWLVQKLLEQCAGLKLLLTSRECTGLAEEQVYPVGPLAEGPAVELFYRWAKHPIAESGRGHVAAICQALDHIPLAVELVARCSRRTPAETLEELQRTRRLDGESDENEQWGLDACHPGQQQSLPLSLDYCYDQLSEELQAFFCTFSVFCDGATKEAMRRVMGDLTRWDWAEELLDRGLLKREPADGTWRYWMLPLVVEYGRQRLREDADRLGLDRAVIQRNYASHYLEVAQQIDDLLTPGKKRQESVEECVQQTGLPVERAQQRIEQAALALLEREKPSALAAVEGAHRMGESNMVWQLAQELTRGLKLLSHWADVEHVYLVALEATRLAGDPYGEGQILNDLGIVYRLQGRWAEAAACYKQDLAIRYELADHRGEGEALANLGLVLAEQGRWAEAIAVCQESLHIFRALRHRHGEGRTLNSLGGVYRHQNRWGEAILMYQQGLAIFRDLGDRHGESEVLTNLGLIYADQGCWTEATAVSQEGLSICRELEDCDGEGKALDNLGNVYRRQGHWAEAIACYERRLSICRELGDRRSEGRTLAHLGLVYADQGRWTEAIAMCHRSLRVFREQEDRYGEGKALASLALVHARQGRWAEAVPMSEDSLQIFRELGDRRGEGKVLANLGLIFAEQGHWAEAIAHSEQALAICRELVDRQGEGEMLAMLGSVHARQDCWAEAMPMYEGSLHIFRELGDRRGEGRALTSLGSIFVERGHWAEAIACYERNLAICRELADRQGESEMLAKLGSIYARQGRPAEVIACCEQRLAICRELGDRYGEGRTLTDLGLIYTEQSRWVEAIPMYQESLHIFRELGDRRGEGEVLSNLTLVYAHQGRWTEAIPMSQESLAIFYELGDRQGEAEMLANLGSVYDEQGRWTKAMPMYEESLDIFRELGDRQNEGRTLSSLGDIHYLQGRWAEAIAYYEQRLVIYCELGDRQGEGEMLSKLGNVYARQGHWAEALDCCEQQLVIFRELGDQQGEGKVLAQLSNLYADQGHWSEAIDTSLESLRISRELGDRHGEGKVLANLGLIYARQGLEGIALARWYQALAIFEALAAPETEQIRGWMKKRAGEG